MPVVNLTFPEIFEEAYDRAGMTMRSGYDLKSVRRSFNIMMSQWANKGLNLWAIEDGTITTTAGQATETLAADTVDWLDATIKAPSAANEIRLNRVAVGTYAKQSTKELQGRPTQFWLERLATPQVTLWPVPDQAYTLRYWRIRRLEGLASGIDGSPDIPDRFMEPLIAGLAYNVALKAKEENVANRIPLLKQMYDAAWIEAAEEDRDRASIFITPGGYR